MYKRLYVEECGYCCIDLLNFLDRARLTHALARIARLSFCTRDAEPGLSGIQIFVTIGLDILIEASLTHFVVFAHSERQSL